jgi:hypothetical protein
VQDAGAGAELEGDWFDVLTLDKWNGEKSNREDIKASKDDQSLVSPHYDAVHPFSQGQLATRLRLDLLSIGRFGHWPCS